VMADIGGDVVIMGVISRSRPNRLFIGNTAEKLLDRLSQDVLVIKPEGFQS
jgi:universal stress protein E